MKTILRTLFYFLPMIFSAHLLIEMYGYDFEVYSYKDQTKKGRPYVTISVAGKHYRLIGRSEDRHVLSVHSSGRSMRVDITFFNEDEDIVSYIKKCKLIQTEEGISFIQPQGSSTFIPQIEYQ